MTAQSSISVIVCSRDRREALQRFLTRFDWTWLSAQQVELVLVADGGARQFMNGMGGHGSAQVDAIRYVSEPGPGLGRARNVGIHWAKGDVLVFTDDDCYFEKGYLESLLRFARESDADFAFGPIRLHDERAARIATDYDATHWLLTQRVAPGQAQGANLVVRRRALSSVGGFDPRLGPGTRFRCDDLDLVARLLAAGFVGVHLPTLAVKHDHCRHAGLETLRLERQNAQAIGAFYAKRLLSGDLGYLPPWVRRLIWPKARWRRRYDLRRAEIAGATAYAWAAMGRTHTNPCDSSGLVLG